MPLKSSAGKESEFAARVLAAKVRLLEFGFRHEEDVLLTRLKDRHFRTESFWSASDDGFRPCGALLT